MLSPDGWEDLNECPECCGPVYPYPYYPYQSGTSAGGGGTIATGCCPGRLLPEKLYGTLVNATGDCGNYAPQSWEFTYVGSTPTAALWESTPPPTLNDGLPGITYQLTCESDGLGNYSWRLGYVAVVTDCIAIGVQTSCNPLLVTFDAEGSALCNGDDFGGRYCNGTYQIIITE
jgi:hypothetical protein